LSRPTLVGKALSFTHELSFFLYLFSFYQSTSLSSRAVNDHQIYSGGSFVGKSSTRGLEILSTPSLIFTGAKSAKFGVVFNITQL